MKISRTFLVISMVFSFLFTISAYAQDGVLKVAEMSGKVLIKTPSATDWVDAKLGQALNPKDVIKTEADGKAMLEFPDKSSFTLKESTQITVQEIVWDKTMRKVAINMDMGKLRTIIKKVDTPTDFKIKTPTAICGASGTIWYTVVQADGTSVYVEESNVEVTAVDGVIRVINEGYYAKANGDGTYSVYTPTDAEREVIAGGYDAGLTGEPYSEPPGNNNQNTGLGDPIAPDVIAERPASGT